MHVFSYYYGAHLSKGIGVRAQSKELENSPISALLKELASLHALGSSDHNGEMLSFFLLRENYRILGASYPELPKDSGYSRIAPCSLQYILPNSEVSSLMPMLGKVINFVSFQKPKTETPEVLRSIPVNDSGYSFHNKPAVLAALIEAFLKVGLAPDQETLLVALPKGKSNEYATARYTIAEVLDHLPVPLRENIRFFTGLPVAEDSSDPIQGFDTAIRYRANVIFCPAEYYERLRTHRSCLSVNMEQPSSTVGSYARYVANVPDTSAALMKISNNMTAPLSYNALNDAVQRIQNGHLVTTELLQQELSASRRLCAEMEQKANQANQELQKWKDNCNKYIIENKRLVTQIHTMPQNSHAQIAKYDTAPVAPVAKDKKSKKKTLFLLIFHLVLVALLAGAFILLTSGKKPNNPPAAPASAQNVNLPHNDSTEQGAADPVEISVPTEKPTPPETTPAYHYKVLEEINGEGKINNNEGANLREWPTTDATRIGVVAYNTRIDVLRKVENQSKKPWYHVKYGEKEGYISASLVDVIKVIPTPVPTPIPTPVSTPEPTAMPTPETPPSIAGIPATSLTPAQPPVSTDTPYTVIAEINKFCTVYNKDEDFTELVSVPSWDDPTAKVLHEIYNGQNDIFVKQKILNNDAEWYAVNYAETAGYIFATFVLLGEPSPSTNPPNSTIVTKDKGPVNFRNEPSISGKWIGSIPNNTRIHVIDSITNEKGELWYKVIYNDNEGYILSDFVERDKTNLDPKTDAPNEMNGTNQEVNTSFQMIPDS